MREKIQSLLEPIQVGPLTLENRMVRAPLLTKLASIEGEVTQKLIDLYVTSAKNKISLILLEVVAVDGVHFVDCTLRIDVRKYMIGLQRLIKAIHLNGVPVILQLNHTGMFGGDPVSPSGVALYSLDRANYIQPRVMSFEEAEKTKDSFIEASVRAKDAEADGVLLHGLNSYLLHQWVSPHTNRRTDRHGGSLENRTTLPLEIVRGIRRQCGPSFAIGYSIVGDEFIPDGITVEHSSAFAQSLKREGVNFIDVGVGCSETMRSDPRGGLSYRQAKGLWDTAEALKKAVNIPIFARSWGEHDPVKWAEAIEKGKCDVIEIGRPLLCDPELPKKLLEDKLDDVRMCIRCGTCIRTDVSRREQITCALNAELCNERDYALRPAPTPKRVLVVGGGPGGLESARVAALRGHEVTIMERKAQLGGNLRVASLTPGKTEFQSWFCDWLERQCKWAGVKIELNKEVTAEIVKEVKPDAVIIANGATPLIPPIAGINKPHVVLAEDVLTGKKSVGKKVIVLGGGDVGLGTADFIADKGLAENITVIVGAGMAPLNVSYMVGIILPNAGVKIITGLDTEEITDEGIVATDGERNRHKFEADTVVIARGYIPNTALYEALKGKVPELYRIGDCVKARTILDAVHEAAYIARQI
jgi:2,4-dienoyl-CoA reductase-like NADH-dependent reductase (Old Yellow Enzyme family)/thioredoxin reductase